VQLARYLYLLFAGGVQTPGADELSRLTSTPVKPETHGAIESQLNSEKTKDQKLNFGMLVANDESHLGWGQERNWGLNSQGRKGY